MSDQLAAFRRGGRLFLILAVSLGALFLLGRAASDLYTEALWYGSVGYGSVLWTRVLVDGGIRLLVGVLTAVVAFLNFRVVARTLGAIQIKRRFGNLEIAERIPRKMIRTGVMVVSAFMGLWLGAAFPAEAGLRLLLFFRAPDWGLVVPPFGHDASFFVFTLPVLGGGLILGLAILFLLFSFSAAGYAATGSVSIRGGRIRITSLARRHLSVLASLFLLLLAARFLISPYFLALDGNSGVQGIFGYADAHARVPGYGALAILTLVTAAVVWWSGFRNRVGPVIGFGIALLVGGILLLQVFPQVVQRFQVEPNELRRETPFIEANLQFTRMGFGLQDLRRRQYQYQRDVVPDWTAAAHQFSGLPIWTRGTLLTTFQEVEARFRYYTFEEVAMDRYPSPAGVTPVAVAAREIDPSGIEDPNWQNLHLRTRYLMGMGAVASAANRRTPQGRPPMFLSGIPPVSSDEPMAPPALTLQDPSVYFGSLPQAYAILSPDSVTTGASGDPDMPEGILLSGPVRKLALAWRFGDANLLFTSEVTGESRFVFKRSVVERAQAVAPFLQFPEAPYPVVDGGRIVWILEGFTTTRSFPLSTPQVIGGNRRTSYLRNSVKVIVDAVTGEINLYRVDLEDPVLEAWSRVFPHVLRPMDEMPQGIRSHIRYSRELLEIQARVLLQYHQETAPRFHRQQDVWALPQELEQNTRPVPYVPEYGLYRLPGEETPEFLLSSVFVPAGRQNLTALFVARCDPEHYGELLLFDIPVEEQVPGPRQVEALVEQDPVISQQFSLWRQGGSQVWSGHLHVIPVGPTILYLEPIFLAAEADAIPELRRFVVSDGRRVSMEPSLEDAIAALAGASTAEAQGPMSGEAENAPTQPSTLGWPSQALSLLEEAESRLRSGDWAGFGASLERLRAVLRQAAEGAGGL